MPQTQTRAAEALSQSVQQVFDQTPALKRLHIDPAVVLEALFTPQNAAWIQQYMADAGIQGDGRAGTESGSGDSVTP